MKQFKMFPNTLIVLLMCLPLMFSCAAEHQNVQSCLVGEPWGFWGGLWHGAISPVSWIISLFDNSIEIWAVNNDGGMYAFGYMIGVGSFATTLRLIARFLRIDID